MAAYRYRIIKDLRDVKKFEETYNCGISIRVINDLRNLKAEITGPAETPYEGGRFLIDITIPPDYPWKPVKVRFLTKIWHPSVNPETGELWCNFLRQNWTPALTLRGILLSLQASLSSAAELGCFMDTVVAKQYKDEPELFRLTAKQWAIVYAGAPNHMYEEEFIGSLENLSLNDM